MSNFSDLDMLYDYEKDASTAATGFMTFSTKVSDPELVTKYMQLAHEAAKVSAQVRKLISKNGGMT
ncbi:MAG: spore coat protein [Peptococcaceae bacterium]|nr:spore coat protein [Peptococcaceae bacterium]